MFTLADLPQPGSKNLAVRVTPAAERQLRKRHPWLYDGGITSDTADAAPGDLAVVFDHRRAFLAVGLFDPASPIQVRLLHAGKPATIDAAWWRSTFDAAWQRRRRLVDSAAYPAVATTGHRLVNGESDAMPGFVADRYDTTIVVKLYTQAWFAHLARVIPAMLASSEAAGVHVDVVVFRLARRLASVETYGLRDGLSMEVTDDGQLVETEPVEPVRFHENGLVFEAAPVSGQKTGHFLDQRDNRQRVRDQARGQRVLDVFSCTGGFSVYAAAGGATEVHSIDMAPEAIAAAERNMALNAAHVGSCRHRTSVGDAFEIMAAMGDRGERYDIVVVDPPSFAHKQSDVVRAESAYRRLTRLAVALVESGGWLVQASCSSRISTDTFVDIVSDAAADAGVHLDDLTTTGHAVDHPVTFPEGYYLKAVFARVTPIGTRQANGQSTL